MHIFSTMDFINVNVFRAKMKGFFDEADSGKDVTISRSKGRFYKLVPYSADSLVMDGLRRLAMHTPNSTKVILFGSRARGNASSSSDWDLLVLTSEERSEDLFDRLCYPFVRFGWDVGAEINPILYTDTEWEKRRLTDLYRNIEKEGIVLCQ